MLLNAAHPLLAAEEKCAAPDVVPPVPTIHPVAPEKSVKKVPVTPDVKPTKIAPPAVLFAPTNAVSPVVPTTPHVRPDKSANKDTAKLAKPIKNVAPGNSVRKACVWQVAAMTKLAQVPVKSARISNASSRCVPPKNRVREDKSVKPDGVCPAKMMQPVEQGKSAKMALVWPDVAMTTVVPLMPNSKSAIRQAKCAWPVCNVQTAQTQDNLPNKCAANRPVKRVWPMPNVAPDNCAKKAYVSTEPAAPTASAKMENPAKTSNAMPVPMTKIVMPDKFASKRNVRQVVAKMKTAAPVKFAIQPPCAVRVVCKTPTARAVWSV